MTPQFDLIVRWSKEIDDSAALYSSSDLGDVLRAISVLIQAAPHLTCSVWTMTDKRPARSVAILRASRAGWMVPVHEAESSVAA